MADELKAENARLAARVAELEAQLASKPPIDRASLYRMTNNAPWGVMAVGLDDRIEYANPALQRWLKVPTPATGEPRAAVVAPDLSRLLDEWVPRALASQPSEAELRLHDA